MKITTEHYNHMRNAIAQFPLTEVTKHREAIIAQGKAKDIDKRLRWDLMYAAKLTPFVCDNLYSYADDTHIDTALRAIIRELYEV